MIRSLLASAACALSLATSAADWPQWRGPNGTGHVPEGVAAPKQLGTDLPVLWRMKAGEGLASPVVAQGKLIYFDAENGRETLRVANLKDQKELWKAVIADTFKDSQGPAGPRCTPLVDDNRVYAQASRGELHCFNLADGSLVWKTSYTEDFGSEFTGEKGNATGAARHGYNASPIIRGNHIFATVGSTNNASVVCFDKSNGKVIWKGGSDQAAYAPLALANLAGVDHIVAFTAESLTGLDAKSGKELWRVPIKTAYGRHVTTPIIWKDLAIVSSHQVGLMAVRVKHDGTGVTAETAWTVKDSAMNFSSPVLVGDHIYGLGPRKDLVCVDAATGKQAWAQTGYFTTSADKAHGAFIVFDDRILTLTDSGELFMFAANPREFKELGRTQVCGSNWCNPAYADGKLYIREGNREKSEILCVELMK